MLSGVGVNAPIPENASPIRLSNSMKHCIPDGYEFLHLFNPEDYPDARTREQKALEHCRGSVCVCIAEKYPTESCDNAKELLEGALGMLMDLNLTGGAAPMSSGLSEMLEETVFAGLCWVIAWLEKENMLDPVTRLHINHSKFLGSNLFQLAQYEEAGGYPNSQEHAEKYRDLAFEKGIIVGLTQRLIALIT